MNVNELIGLTFEADEQLMKVVRRKDGAINIPAGLTVFTVDKFGGEIALNFGAVSTTIGERDFIAFLERTQNVREHLRISVLYPSTNYGYADHEDPAIPEGAFKLSGGCDEPEYGVTRVTTRYFIPKRRVILVGRHTGDLPGYEVVEQRAVTFALNTGECFKQLSQLHKDAKEAKAALVFQNIPGIVAATLLQNHDALQMSMVRWGVIISVPGERQAGVVEQFHFMTESSCKVDEAERAVKFANGRAKTETADGVLTVTVDPVTPFVFSHIEWF